MNSILVNTAWDTSMLKKLFNVYLKFTSNWASRFFFFFPSLSLSKSGNPTWVLPRPKYILLSLFSQTPVSSLPLYFLISSQHLVSSSKLHNLLKYHCLFVACLPPLKNCLRVSNPSTKV